MDYGASSGLGKLSGRTDKKVKADLIEYLAWMHYNGDSIEFMERLAEGGRKTALDEMPTLDEEGRELWQMYCYTGDDILICLDVYARRIGIPFDWAFEECIGLVSKLREKKYELVKLDRKSNE